MRRQSAGWWLMMGWVGMVLPAVSAAQAEPWISNGPKLYPAAVPGRDCTRTLAPSLQDEEAGTFWEDAGAGNSISFNPATWVLTVCHGGQAVAARLDGQPGGTFLVTVKTPFFRDLNGDGKPEFLVWYGQCVEEPCRGEHLVLQVDGKRIRRLVSTRSERVDLIHEDGRDALLLTRYCFAHESDIAYEYFGLAVFGPRGDLAMAPGGSIRERFPRTLSRVTQGIRDSVARLPSTEENDAWKRIQFLILDAYLGQGERKAHDVGMDAALGTSCKVQDILGLVGR